MPPKAAVEGHENRNANELVVTKIFSAVHSRLWFEADKALVANKQVLTIIVTVISYSGNQYDRPTFVPTVTTTRDIP
jgi:hypothetical protein